jgi:hypothetical protein
VPSTVMCACVRAVCLCVRAVCLCARAVCLCVRALCARAVCLCVRAVCLNVRVSVCMCVPARVCVVLGGLRWNPRHVHVTAPPSLSPHFPPPPLNDSGFICVRACVATSAAPTLAASRLRVSGAGRSCLCACVCWEVGPAGSRPLCEARVGLWPVADTCCRCFCPRFGHQRWWSPMRTGLGLWASGSRSP